MDIDRLGAEGFDAVVSLHAFGGFLYYPWSGDFSPPPDKATYEAMGQAMAAGQSDGDWAIQIGSRGLVGFVEEGKLPARPAPPRPPPPQP